MTKTIKLKNENGSIAVYITEARARAVGTLICVHGGPGGDHRGNENIFGEIGKYCGSAGYHIVQFDMFGAGKSDGSPDQITLKSQLRDFATVFDYAEKQLRSPIHIVGESMGATIAALAWRPEAATYVLLWPAFDLRDTDLKPYLSNEWFAVLQNKGLIEDNGIVLGKEFISEVKSTDFSGCYQLPAKPCLLVHGKGDAAVPFEQSLTAVAQGAGACVLFAHPTGDHGLQRPEERAFTHRAIKWWLSVK
jgi:uncharacterized protein